MTAAHEGTVTTLVTAGHITRTDQPPHPTLGHQVAMGDVGAVFMHISPYTARQWIGVLETIATTNEKSSK